MTGKELVLLLGGSILAGGATAGVVATHAAGNVDYSADTAKIDARLERIEAVLEKTADSIRRSHSALSDLGARMSGVEMQAANAARAAGERTKFVRGDTSSAQDVDMDVDWAGESLDLEGIEINPEALAKLKKRFGELKELPVSLGGEILGPGGEKLENSVVHLSGMLDSLRKSSELRKLPENERWEKAQEDLGLSYNQIEDLKRAVETRDTAMKDAMVTDRDEETDTGRFTIKRLDPAKAAKAHSDYQDTVKTTLTKDQRKGWRDKGYDRAFGGRSGGTAVQVMSIGGTLHTETKPTDSGE